MGYEQLIQQFCPFVEEVEGVKRKKFELGFSKNENFVNNSQVSPLI